MIDPKAFEDLAKRFTEAVPPGVRQFQAEMEKNFHAALQTTFAKLELVTREEFDVQQEVLARTREQLAALETRLTELEATLAFKDAPADSTPATPPAGSDTQP